MPAAPTTASLTPARAATLALLCAAGLAGGGRALGAQRASGVVELLDGRGFHGAISGYNTETGSMSTVLLGADAEWRRLEALVGGRIFSGDFRDASGAPYVRCRSYGEADLRFDLRSSRADSEATIRRVYTDAQLERSTPGSAAELLGAGASITASHRVRVISTVFFRHPNRGANGVKWKTEWHAALGHGRFRSTFGGGAMMTTRGARGTSVTVRPHWFADLGALTRGRLPAIGVGVESYHHFEPHETIAAWQLAVRWSP